MAPRDSSTSRPRDSSTTGRKHGHKKKKTRDPSARRTATASEGSSSAAQGLSLDALAQLNEYNSRHAVEESTREPERVRRRKDRRPREDEYIIVEPEEDTPRKERRTRDDYTKEEREARRAARRERRRRETFTDDEGTYDKPRRESRRRQAPTDGETDYEAPRRERRRRGAATDGETDHDTPRRERRQKVASLEDDEHLDYERYQSRDDRKKKRMVSGAIVEEGRATSAIRGGAGSKHSSYDSLAAEKEDLYYKPPLSAKKKKRNWIIGGIVLAVLIIVIVVAVVVSKKNSTSSSDTGKSGLDNTSESDIPVAARGTYLDPFTWYDTTDFNVTYTNDTVGDLPIMGLNSTWDDSIAANSKVPALSTSWGDYATTPARGVNLGGWLSLEPWITPSLFNYDSKLGIIDEWTLSKYLGAKTASSTIEKHYATFVTEQTFSEIAAAGLDHVRIPYSYWAVITYDDDPYVFRTSWRYLLRGIEWCRKHGLRVNLDLHALPGSQNGWNHSGRLGPIGWLNGTNGELNRQRSLDVHDRLSKFFAQDRYKNIVTFYGLANEPRMVNLDATAVVNWTTQAYKLVKANGVTANIVFGDGFMGLENWQGKLTGMDDLVLDVHQYVIFNNEQIIYTHKEKVTYACSGWSQQTEISLDTSTGYGPTMFAEWSQADTDCAEYLNNVGWGNRWEGTYASGNVSTQALTPRCPAENSTCSCTQSVADVSSFSNEYKLFLKMFAEAQMVSFEKGWGWWYWTWDTEDAPLWSYKQGLAAGILPSLAYEKDFNCNETVPDFAAAGLSEVY